ncbi:hypothetical protein DFH05DRAFT_1459539 [Lentinula detonsa]|uniref:Uncharacterized protein n=1 Tax=Lentinula detonsa TaxID=2804962 RepID=A0A9W8P2W0_9AGAR|nr:hypothetical protein DFH05DRAFT_1459539 [Lentinula detonsa]
MCYVLNIANEYSCGHLVVFRSTATRLLVLLALPIPWIVTTVALHVAKKGQTWTSGWLSQPCERSKVLDAIMLFVPPLVKASGKISELVQSGRCCILVTSDTSLAVHIVPLELSTSKTSAIKQDETVCFATDDDVPSSERRLV